VRGVGRYDAGFVRHIGSVHVYRLIRIGVRDMSNVTHSDRLLAISWFVTGIWKWDNCIEPVWLQASAVKYIRTAVFWNITQPAVVIPYWRFGTTYRSYFQGSKVFCLEDGADLLSRNFGMLLPIYYSYCNRRAQFLLQTNNNFTLNLR